mmetsp:Transcript_8788/g.32412  ORF Transcript_8788/g.32412 Transcript_8788/m.32412 type:complete len:285 (-) Transcript_8788:1079-1933(-)
MGGWLAACSSSTSISSALRMRPLNTLSFALASLRNSFTLTARNAHTAFSSCRDSSFAPSRSSIIFRKVVTLGLCVPRTLSRCGLFTSTTLSVSSTISSWISSSITSSSVMMPTTRMCSDAMPVEPWSSEPTRGMRAPSGCLPGLPPPPPPSVMPRAVCSRPRSRSGPWSGARSRPRWATSSTSESSTRRGRGSASTAPMSESSTYISESELRLLGLLLLGGSAASSAAPPIGRRLCCSAATSSLLLVLGSSIAAAAAIVVVAADACAAAGADEEQPSLAWSVSW